MCAQRTQPRTRLLPPAALGRRGRLSSSLSSPQLHGHLPCDDQEVLRAMLRPAPTRPSAGAGIWAPVTKFS